MRKRCDIAHRIPPIIPYSGVRGKEKRKGSRVSGASEGRLGWLERGKYFFYFNFLIFILNIRRCDFLDVRLSVRCTRCRVPSRESDDERWMTGLLGDLLCTLFNVTYWATGQTG